jgi:hypothetical protein
MGGRYALLIGNRAFGHKELARLAAPANDVRALAAALEDRTIGDFTTELNRHYLFHAKEGWLAAENEVLYLCVDQAVRRVMPWPADKLALFAARAGRGTPKRLALNRPG